MIKSINSKVDYLLNHALKDTSERKIIYSRAKRENHQTKNKKYYRTYATNTLAQKRYFEELKKEFEEL